MLMVINMMDNIKMVLSRVKVCLSRRMATHMMVNSRRAKGTELVSIFSRMAKNIREAGKIIR